MRPGPRSRPRSRVRKRALPPVVPVPGLYGSSVGHRPPSSLFVFPVGAPRAWEVEPARGSCLPRYVSHATSPALCLPCHDKSSSVSRDCKAFYLAKPTRICIRMPKRVALRRDGAMARGQAPRRRLRASPPGFGALTTLGVGAAKAPLSPPFAASCGACPVKISTPPVPAGRSRIIAQCQNRQGTEIRSALGAAFPPRASVGPPARRAPAGGSRCRRSLKMEEKGCKGSCQNCRSWTPRSVTASKASGPRA